MVDNKTDLGVMALSLLALLAGMIFLGIVQHKDTHKKEIWKYLIIAGVFFAFATLAKSTAFVDLALFGIFLIGLWISPRSAVGVGLGLTGVLRYMDILTSSFMITQGEAKWLIIIGVLLTVIGVGLALWKKKKLGTSIGYLLLLGVSFLVPLVIFRVPWLTVQQLSTNSFSPKAVVKGLFTQVEGEVNLAEQDQIDTTALASLSWEDSQQSAENCLGMNYDWSEEELAEGLQEVKGGGLVEDFGRYIGFGWKEFHPGNGTYALAKLFFPSSEDCY